MTGAGCQGDGFAKLQLRLALVRNRRPCRPAEAGVGSSADDRAGRPGPHPLHWPTGSDALMARFPIRFDKWYRIFSSALLLPPSDSYVEVTDDTVTVRMSWGFSARFPRSAIAAASRFAGAPLSRGVHGFAGRWLVNGAGDRILQLDLEPPQRGRVLGFPVRLRQLLVSVDEPEELAKQLRPS